MSEQQTIQYWWINQKGAGARPADALVWLPEHPRSKHSRKASLPATGDVHRVLPGDLIFAYADGAVRGLGIALANPVQHSQVAVRFFELALPLSTKPHMAALKPLLPRRHSPLRATGVRNPAVTLAPISAAMAAALRRLLAGQLEAVEAQIKAAVGSELADDWVETAIRHRAGLGAADKQQLIRARRGLGVFRSNLEKIEHACRVTGVLDRRHLRACHIKPWSVANDEEKLDGDNGLLLSPHIADLFCRGYISFSDQGELLTSRALNPAVLKTWKLALPINVGAFRPRQRAYLDYHRREIFDRPGIGRNAAL